MTPDPSAADAARAPEEHPAASEGSPAGGPVREARAATAAGQEDVAEELEELIEALDPNPAFVVDRRWDILAANRTARSLFSDWGTKHDRLERNLLWFYCCDPAARSLFVDWEHEAADQVALFRKAQHEHPHDPRYAQVLDAVVAANPKVQGWWDAHATSGTRGTTKRIRLDNGHVVLLRQLLLSVMHNPDIHVVSYFAASFDGLDEDDDADVL